MFHQIYRYITTIILFYGASSIFPAEALPNVGMYNRHFPALSLEK